MARAWGTPTSVHLVAIALLVSGFAFAGTAAAAAPTCAGDASDFDGGDGSAGDPYRIADIDQFQCAGHTNHLANHFVLVDDIDASDTATWNGGDGFDPIGTGSTPFSGSFDGQGHAVSNLTIDRSEGYVGPFGHVTGTITNVGFANVDIVGGGQVGGIAGRNDGGTVSGSSVTGNVSGSGSVIGGIIGYNRGGTVNDSYATGNVSGSNYVGGIIGYNIGGGTVSDSFATNNVTGNDFVGGVAGVNSGTVRTSYATGNVSGSSDVGGLAGTGGGTVIDSYWDTERSGQATSDGGTGLTTDQMTGEAAETNMTGFDLESVWRTTDSYPILRWMPNGPAGMVGGGMADDPYVVTNATQLQAMNEEPDAHYVLVDDVNASDTATWNGGDGFDPIGNSSTPFSGSFDGQGHAISNLTINRSSESYVGPFGYVTGTITNVGFTNIDVVGNSRVGGIAGESNGGTVNKSYATGNVSGSNYVGGIAGWNAGTVNDSFATNNVTGDAAIGGVAGVNGGTVRTSYATGNVSGSSDVGGLVGTGGGTVTDSYWDTERSEQSSSDGGTGLITDQMTGEAAQSNMTGFDWQDTWATTPAYPALQWATGPMISGFVATNASGQNVSVSFESDVQLTAVEVSLSGPSNQTLTRANFTESGTGPYYYQTISAVSSDGNYTVTLTEASDSDGKDGANDQSDTVVIDTIAPTISNFTVGNPSGKNVSVAFNSSEQLSLVQVSLTGPEWATLTLANFTRTGSGPYNYSAVYDGSSNGTYTATLDVALDAGNNDGAASQSGTVSIGRAVVDSQLQFVGGTHPDVANLTLDAWFSGGLLQVQAKNATANVSDFSTEADYELAGLGADDTTILQLNVTVQEFVPRVLIGSGHDVNWTRTDNGDGTWTISITGKPAALDSYFEADGSSPLTWPGTLQANESQDAALTFAVDSLAPMPSQYRERLNGSIMSTDAQEFASPQYNTSGATDRVELLVKGPHFAKNGANNTGFFEAYLPQALLDAWGVSASQLTGQLNGVPRATSVQAVPGGGARVAFDVHYSEADAAITFDAIPPSADAGANQTVDEDAQVPFDGTNSTDDVGVASYEWDFGDGSANVTGATPTHVFADPGSYTVVLTVSDAAGNDESDTLVVTVNDTTPPAADAGNDVTVRVGTALEFDATSSSDNAGITSYEWDFGDGTSSTNATEYHTYGSLGTYTATLNVTDAAGNLASDVRNVTVTPKPQPSRSASSTDSTSSANSTRDELTVFVSSAADGEAGRSNVSVRNTEPGNPIVIALDSSENATSTDERDGPDDESGGASRRSANVSVSQLTMNVTGGEDFTLNITTYEHSENESVDEAFLRDTGASPAGYVVVDHSISDDDIESVAFQFRVSKTYFETRGLNPDSVALYRDEGARWRELDATPIDETATHYVFEATSPGLSVFAIGSAVPVYELVDVTLDRTTITPGEAVDVTLSIANHGGATGTFDGTILANGEPIEDATLTVAAFGEGTTTLSVAFDEPGTYELTIGREVVGTLIVQSKQVIESTPAPTDSVDESGDTGIGRWVLVPLGLLALIAIAVVVFGRYNKD